MADSSGDKGQQPRRPRPGASPGLGAAATGGVEFATSILVGLFVGWWADRRIGTGPWLLILGAFAGAAAGFYRLYRALTTGGNAPRSRPRDQDSP